MVLLGILRSQYAHRPPFWDNALPWSISVLNSPRSRLALSAAKWVQQRKGLVHSKVHKLRHQYRQFSLGMGRGDDVLRHTSISKLHTTSLVAKAPSHTDGGQFSWQKVARFAEQRKKRSKKGQRPAQAVIARIITIEKKPLSTKN